MTSTDSDFYPEVRYWRLPRAAVATSYAEMAADGARDREGIALWAGRRQPHGVAEVCGVVLLRGPEIFRDRGFIEISPSLMNDVTDALDEISASLVAQIHSHPPDCTTDLSPTDVRYGIGVPHYLSIVAPDYASRPFTTVAEWGVHVFEPSRRWRRLTTAEAVGCIQITDGDISVVTIGPVVNKSEDSAFTTPADTVLRNRLHA